MPGTRFSAALAPRFDRDPDPGVTIRARLTVALLAAWAGAGGCGGGSGGASIPISDLEAQIVDAVCNWRVGCAQSPDKATCLRSVELEPGFYPTIQADIASDKVIYDGAKARACVDLLDALAPCTQSATATAARQVTDTCKAVFTGTIATGGACFFKEECAGDASCNQTDPSCAQACCAGTCGTPLATPATAGQSCSNVPCATGLYCDFTTSPQSETCAVPSSTEGAACNQAGSCAAPLFCDLDTTTGTGTCKHAVATGARCNTSAGSNSCDDLRDRCDATSSTCVPRGAVGATCDTSMGITCVGYATCTGGTCVAQPEGGDSCDPAGPACYSGLTCDPTTLKCTAPPEGGACM